MKTNFSLLFYLKKPKNFQGGLVPIYIRITVNGARAELTYGRECSPENWNITAGRVKGTKEETKTLNAYLDNLQSQIHEAHYQQTVSGMLVTANELKNRMLGKGEKVRTLLSIFQDHNKKIAVLAGKEYAPGTIGRYEIALMHTQNYINWKYKIADIDIKKNDHDFVINFDFYLRSERKCANNSAVKYIKNFGKIIRICLANGWLEKDPFINYKAKVKRIDRSFLSQDELQSIADKILSTDRLGQVKDIFLFCCFTGLSYADVSKLSKNEIAKGLDGEMWIHTTRRKTDTISRIPLLPSAVNIIAKYANHPVCVNNNRVLPVPSNQKVNEYLKEIAGICGIDKPLTFHIARHTFATTITLSNGVPIESVSKCLVIQISRPRSIMQKFWTLRLVRIWPGSDRSIPKKTSIHQVVAICDHLFKLSNKTPMEPQSNIPDEVIISKIIVLRNKKVMIDRDLAALYGVTTKRLNEQVKRNQKRFPGEFMFQTTADEKELLMWQFDHLAGLKYSAALPYVFTEHGAVMLASVLNSDQAIAVNMQIVRVFINVRQMLTDTSDIRLEIEKIKNKLANHDKSMETVFLYLDELSEKVNTPKQEAGPRKRIGYKSYES